LHHPMECHRLPNREFSLNFHFQSESESDLEGCRVSAVTMDSCLAFGILIEGINDDEGGKDTVSRQTRTAAVTLKLLPSMMTIDMRHGFRGN
jgi:hypothetical protein